MARLSLSLLLTCISLFHLSAIRMVSGTNVGVSIGLDINIGHGLHDEPFWLESIKHQGISAYHSNPGSYQVFRNVKDFGAIGDGITDDTVAINNAISAGNRCGGGGCHSSTVTPALVYFPRGTYLVSASINAYYYTQLVGDPKSLPVILAAPNFEGLAVIDADPYIPGGGGAQWYANTNNFFRSVRNFVIDVRQVPAERPQGTCIHWQVSQATSLANIRFEMSAAPGTAHQGVWMENGSGGYMGDLIFNGGKYGMWVGNQQFTVRNVTFNNAQSAIFSHWNWGWTFQDVKINNCQVGFDLLTGGLTIETQGVGAIAIIDAIVANTPIFVRHSKPSNGSLTGSLVINNARLQNVPVAVAVLNGSVVLPGSSGTMKIKSWGQGNVYSGTDPKGKYVKGDIDPGHKASSLLDGSGRIVSRMRPQYEGYSVGQFVSVRDYGAKGDGKTDDTKAIKAILRKFADCKVIFFDAGTYIVTSTITIPPGTRMVGEAWSVISGSGPAFQDERKPRPVIKVGEPGSCGIIEITDIVFSTIGPAAGAIVVEWNIREPAGQKAGAGMWDSHIRLGGTAGTNLERGQCPPGADPANCMAAFLGLHLTPGSSAYLEATWVWLADHDLDGDGESQISIYSGRGILSESRGPVWMIGTAEHHVMYQYRLVNAENHYMGLIQTESPYYQPTPPAPAPFAINSAFKDPIFTPAIAQTSAWGLSVQNSKDIFIFGAGLYSFFNNYSQDCIQTRNCQRQIADIDTRSSVYIYSLSTVATTYQVSVNGAGVIDQKDNINAFASTVTLWSSDRRRH